MTQGFFPFSLLLVLDEAALAGKRTTHEERCDCYSNEIGENDTHLQRAMILLAAQLPAAFTRRVDDSTLRTSSHCLVKYSLGRDSRKARMRKLAKPGKFPESSVRSQRLRDAAVSTDFPEMPEHGDN